MSLYNDPFTYFWEWHQQTTSIMKKNQQLFKMNIHDSAPLVAQSPKDIIWTRNKAKLYRFHNDNIKHSTPVLMIYALINRPYILDLTPGNSMVEFLLKEGFDVYMVDWGTPGLEDSQQKFDDLVLDYLPDIFRSVQVCSQAERVSLLGYCMGGTITAMFAALHTELPIANLIFLASPIDFKEAGLFTNWLKPATFNVDKMVEVMGNIPPEAIDFGSKLLKPVTNFVSTYKNLWLNLENEEFVQNWRVINHWVNDGVPFPGETFRQWIKEFYQKNALVKKELFLRGRQVDLSKISCPVLNMVGTKDHIALPNQSEVLGSQVSSEDYELVRVPVGHVSLTIGKQARKHTWPKVKEFLASHI